MSTLCIIINFVSDEDVFQKMNELNFSTTEGLLFSDKKAINQ